MDMSVKDLFSLILVQIGWEIPDLAGIGACLIGVDPEILAIDFFFKIQMLVCATASELRSIKLLILSNEGPNRKRLLPVSS